MIMPTLSAGAISVSPFRMTPWSMPRMTPASVSRSEPIVKLSMLSLEPTLWKR